MVERTYPVTKNGIQFEVRATSREEAAQKAQDLDPSTTPRLIARQGTTRVFERPNGQRYVVSPGFSSTKPDAVEKALSGMGAGEISRQGIDESLIQQYPVAARAGGFVRGVPFVGSRLDEALGILGPEATAGARALSGAMQRQRPGETMGLNLAGGLTAAVGGAAAAPQAIVGATGAALGTGTRASQIGRGILAGATAGGIEGGIYGSGEGTTGAERLERAAQGAGFGGAAGGLLGGAAPIVSDVAENVMGLFRRSDVRSISRDLGISTDAAKVIRNTFDQGGDINAAIANLQRAGQEAMIVDAGDAAQALLDATRASGGEAGQIVTSAIDERMARTNQALTQSLDQSLGPAPLGPQTAIREIGERTKPARTQAYDLAYSTPIDYAAPAGRKIEEVLGRIEPDDLSRAIREANAEMRSVGEVNQQILASIDANGNATFIEMPNVRQLDELKKSLQRIAYSNENTDQFGRLTGTGQRYNRLAGELRDAVADAVQPYGAAVSIGGDKLAEERAFMLGRDLLRSSTEIEDVMLELGPRPSQQQVAAAKSGFRSYVEKALGDVRAIASDPGADALEARQVIKAVTDMSSDNARAKIRELMGAEADALLRQIDEAAQSASVRAAMAQNSKTAGRLAQQQTVDEITAPGAIGQALQGEAVNTTKALIQAVTGQTAEYTAARRQAIYRDIARALTEKRGDDAMMALRALDAAMRGQQMTDAQTDKLAKLISGVLFSGTTPAATRGLETEYSQ